METSSGASGSTALPVDCLMASVEQNDLQVFEEAVRSALQSSSYAGARTKLQDCAARYDQTFGLLAARCCVQLAGRQPRNMQAIALLSELRPSSATSSSSGQIPPPSEVQALACELAAMDADMLKIAVRLMQTWGVTADASSMDDVTQQALAAAILREARNGAGGQVAAAGALATFPGLLQREEQSWEVLEAAEGDGSRDDVAERLAKNLGRTTQMRLVRHRQESKRLRPAARAVHAFGLLAEFPNADFDWRSQALESALRHGHKEALMGLSFCEPRLRQKAVEGLLQLGHSLIAVELAGAWEIQVTVEAAESAAAQRSQIESSHSRLPEAVEVKFVDNEEILESMLASLLGGKAIGLDAEWRPAEGSPPCLLQLAAEEVVYLVDLVALGASQALGDALREVASTQTVVKVGFDGATDLSRIAKAYPALKGCERAMPVLDVRTLEADRRVREEGMSKKQAKDGISLASVAQRHFGLPLDKTMQMSDWGRRPLSEMQAHYAALDAWAPLQIYLGSSQ